MNLEFLANLPLMSQIFLVALLVPLLYWLIPARWRTGFLLGVSLITLLRGGISIEYLAILSLLICLVWGVVSPSQQEDTSLAPLPFYMGLSGITLFALALALSQRIPVTAGFQPLILPATFAAVTMIGLALLTERWLVRGLARHLLPLIALVAFTYLFAPSVDFIALRFVASPPLLVLLIITAGLSCMVCLVWAARASHQQRQWIALVGIVLLILIFIIDKWPAQGTPLAWFGFSYIAFRLLHVLLDYRLNTPLSTATPAAWGLYTLFFSAQAVGPIDRWPRFDKDLHSEKRFSWDDFVTGWERILWGAIKKFFIADILLRPLIPGEILITLTNVPYAWLQLYAYALYLYCDFSGIVDIALGTARLVGFHLPENFNRPYFQGSIAQFWQSWHITLSSWLRTYVFLPLSRTLLRSRIRRFSLLIVLIANLVTMSLVGLWHGITWNFLLWGVWHAMGLFIHKMFSDRTRRRQMRWKNTWKEQAFYIFSVLLTFHFVLLGWVFFALPSVEASITYLLFLFGIRL
jgi:D-alanyl-lipoteichoic acid acyltransferase DltB (MBOAT superfamily)